MSLIYQSSKKNFENNKRKIFFDNLTKYISGEECLYLLDKASNLIKEKNIKNIAIISKNCICWPIWYIASDKYCNNVFILSPELDQDVTKSIITENNVQLTIRNPDILLSDNPLKNMEINMSSGKDIDNLRKDILFTSGTTNIPKGVIVSEKAFCHVANVLIKKFDMSPSDNELLSMPFYHSFGLTRLRCVLLSHSQAIITDGLKNFPEVYKSSKNKKLTGLSLVPSGIIIIKNLLRKKVSKFVSNIKYFEIGSSSINYEIRIWLKENFKSSYILHHYGMTEASRSFMIGRGYLDNIKQTNNFIGSPIKDCKTKLNKINKNNIGELLIKGKNLFNGYINNEDNKNKFIDGWYKTGDLCKKQGGKFKIIGRVDNQINIGGNKVHAEIIEEKIEKLPNILRSLCFSTKNVFFGNSISLIIEKKKKSSTNTIRKNILKNFEKEPSFLIPKKILFKKIKLKNNVKKIRKFLEI